MTTINLDITNRDLYGNVTFLLKSARVYGIENVIQKVTTCLMSSKKTTYFGNVYGSDALQAGKYNFNADGVTDFKLQIIDDLVNIKSSIQADETTYNIPVADRLKDVTIKDVVFDNTSLTANLSLLISTNSASTIVQLPVKS